MSRVLLVDDDPQVLNLLARILEREGHQVLVAENGNLAVETFLREPTDLVITDIIMPEKEGIETIMELRGINPQVKIIAISGGGRINPADYLAWAEKFGVRHTFTKPVGREDLLAAVNELLAEECGQES